MLQEPEFKTKTWSKESSEFRLPTAFDGNGVDVSEDDAYDRVSLFLKKQEEEFLQTLTHEEKVWLMCIGLESVNGEQQLWKLVGHFMDPETQVDEMERRNKVQSELLSELERVKAAVEVVDPKFDAIKAECIKFITGCQ